ncbi:LysM domain-containing protein [Paraphoma chrysanthemicola]|uniref:LysM domain-containing protein n=1 Tax=Paraphoma chrysanthemicola TaxID=798071 RepID=A0A8K0RCR3_9PLEO|nr:LysM domain-containing protein [Paraphoma chrysanthemicola]
MSFSRNSLLALVASSSILSDALKLNRLNIRPNLPYDVNTSKNCSWWVDYDGSQTCAQMLDENWIDLESFRRWNPTIGSDCAGLTSGRSYCVEAAVDPTTSTPTLTPTSTPVPSVSSSSIKTIVIPSVVPSPTTAVSSPTTTSAGNGVATPQPTQPGMVTNCAKFHWIAKGVTCSQVISYQKITLQDFVKWNPTVLNDCSGMWAEVQVCVGVIGGTTPTTTTTAGNGVVTPQPTQPGMVTNCAKFHWIAQGVTCSQVISYQKITLQDFVKWNPTVNSDCSGMWAEVQVCVGVIGGPTTTTTAGNGIQTPQPTQPGMVTNCKKFHYAETGVVCSQITSFNRISLADFVKWNPGVGPDCTTMWAKTFTCVGV